jgi:hypothetical protein
LREARLFVDGAQAGAVLSPPARSAEFINHVVLGAKCGGLWNPTAHFRGDIREVRMYGRNLSPAEFLGALEIELTKSSPCRERMKSSLIQ